MRTTTGTLTDSSRAAATTPVRAEFFGPEVETLRLYDAQNQRSVMTTAEVTIRPARELLLGPERGRAAAVRLRAETRLEHLRQDVRDDWEEQLERLAQGHGFAGVELFGRAVMSDRRHGRIGAALDGRDSYPAPDLGAFADGPFEQSFLHRRVEEGE